MKDYTKDLSGPFYLDPRSPRPAPYNEVEEGGLKIRESPTPPDISIVDYDLLVDKVRGIRSSLVTVETECIQIENAQTSITNILTASDKQGQAVPARLVSRGGMRKLARRFSRRSRTWRRLNDQLLPLLHRNQDFELSRQLLTATKLYTSLLGLLNRIKLVTGVLEDALFKGYSRLSHPVLFSWRNISYYSAEQELLNLLHQIETIFARLQEKFRTKYDELIRNGSLIGAIATEVTLTDVIFEFPNNIRHICTTMPWTISLVLAVLWGVCWMFYTSAPGIEPEVPLETAEPSATFDFNYDPGAGLQNLEVPGFELEDVNLAPIQSSLYNDAWIAYGPFDTSDPLLFVQNAPQDPKFLFMDAPMSGSLRNSREDLGGLAEALSLRIPPNPTPQPDQSTQQRLSSEPAMNTVSIGNGEQEPGSNSPSQQARPRFVCSECQETFTTSFALNRHVKESHVQTELFPCPNPGCKRSHEKNAFKRPYNLKRHLETCKHRDTSISAEERSSALATSDSSPALPDPLHRPVVLSVQLAEPRGRKRQRVENQDEESSDGRVLRDMMREHERIAKEVEVKKREYSQALDDLKRVAAAIEIWKGKKKDDT